jgi:hypothetical protein
MKHTRIIFALCCLTVLGIGTGTTLAQHRPTTRPAVVNAVKPLNPLLPKQIAPEQLSADLGMAGTTAPLWPAGITPSFTAEDWQTYRTNYGPAVDAVLRQRSTQVIAQANLLLDATQQPEHTPGLRRLLCQRAIALTYRTRGGYEVAARGVLALQSFSDTQSISQMLTLWAAANGISQQAVTPKPQRPAFGLLAAKANVQLCVLLVHEGQLDAANYYVRVLQRYDYWARQDEYTRGCMSQARALASQTATALTQGAEWYEKIRKGDESGAEPLYLLARFGWPMPNLVMELSQRHRQDRANTLHEAIETGLTNPGKALETAKLLQGAAGQLPEGMLRSRVLFASAHFYRLFLNAPQTQELRVERTLARLGLQAVISDGARPAAVIRPFAPPPTTAPASQPHVPVAQG